MTGNATFKEIAQQPQVWRDFAGKLAAEAAEIRGWIDDIAPRQIWLSGAGTSAFIGEILAPSQARMRAIATTDLVACPGQFLREEGPIVALQFGRSGNSSETVGMLDLLDAHRPDIHRLHITCNAESALATRAGPGPGTLRTLILPETTHDAGFAMTSSFSTMALAALSCLEAQFDPAEALPRMAELAQGVLEQAHAALPPRPKRLVFLGAGALKGAARESALKVGELTAGATATLWDSPLGFRHGPKSFVGDETAIVLLRHPDPHTARYDADLEDELRRQFPEVPLITIGAGGTIAVPPSGGAAADAVLAVLPAQVWAAEWSAQMGLNVDNPFEAEGNLTRVVSGVTLHRWPG